MNNRTNAISHCLALPSWVCRASPQVGQAQVRRSIAQTRNHNVIVYIVWSLITYRHLIWCQESSWNFDSRFEHLLTFKRYYISE